MHISLPVAVISIVIKDGKVLLLKRKNTPWMNGYWGLPGGRLDVGEGMLHGAIRELEEEVAISLTEKSINYKGIIHHSDGRGERLYFMIASSVFTGEPKNNEPEKCSDLGWFNVDQLPEKITPQVKICMEAYKNKKVISEYGF